MRFLFNMCNHNKLGQRSLEDVITIMSHQLRALGHECGYEPANTRLLDGNPGQYNIIVEGFTVSSVNLVREFRNKGARFIILATEEPTIWGFNQGSTPEELLKAVREANAKGEKFTQLPLPNDKALDREMIWRQKMFPEAAKFCDGILHLVPGEHVTAWYSQWAPAAQADLGYSPSLVRGNDIEPDFSFGFYGSLTRRRMQILKKLARASQKDKAVKLEGQFSTQDERDHDMRRAKVIIQVRKFEQMGLVSSSRCNTALHLGRPVIAEPHELSKPWDDIVRFSSTLNAFYMEAVMMSTAWRGAHAKQMEAFRRKMTPEFCFGEPLKQAGITWDNIKAQQVAAKASSLELNTADIETVSGAPVDSENMKAAA